MVWAFSAKTPQLRRSAVPQIRTDEISVMYVEMDGTGIPVVKAETEGRQGKIDGQPAYTREVKLGCVFSQTEIDGERRPVRDYDSTTYTGAIETAERFGRRIYREAWDRGWDRAKTKVVLGDGAPWIWNIAEHALLRRSGPHVDGGYRPFLHFQISGRQGGAPAATGGGVRQPELRYCARRPFLLNVPLADRPPAPITVILNWTEQLKESRER